MSLTESAVFPKLQFLRCFSLVFGCRIIPSLTLSAGKGNDISHIGSFSILKCDDFAKGPSATLHFIATTKITEKHEEKELKTYLLCSAKYSRALHLELFTVSSKG